VSIDLSLLPAPNVIEPLDYRTIMATLRADVLTIAPELADVLMLESETATKLCRVFAYRELILRARINDAATATMLAYAKKYDLDHRLALLGVERLPNEKDARYRARGQLALEGFTTAGPRLSYKFHALSTSVDVRDVYVDSPIGGAVRIVVLAEPSDDRPTGVPSQQLLTAVLANVSGEDKRPLCDTPYTIEAQVIDYNVAATVDFYQGPGSDVALAAARSACAAHVSEQFRLGYDITVSGIKKSLRQPGISRASLTSPAMVASSDVEHEDILIPVGVDQAARCLSIDIKPGEIAI
jgi:phage-related baseplate assembly protein